MKSILRLTLVILLSVVITSIFDDYRPSVSLINTLFTVASIMFAIGLGLIVSFNPDGVNNRNYLNRIRANVKNVRNNFLIEFFIISVCFVGINIDLAHVELALKFLKFNFLIFCGIQIFISIFYFAYNFLEIQKLKDDVFDRVLSDRLQG